MSIEVAEMVTWERYQLRE